MAESTVKVVFLGDSSKLKREVDGIDDSTSKAERGFGKLGAAIGGAVAVGSVVSLGKGAFDAAIESQKIAAQTEAAIKSTGAAAGITADEIGDMATAMSKKNAVDDEAIQTGQNLLLTFTNIGKAEGIFERTTQASIDMAAAMGTDVKSAAMQLGKALNDPTDGLSKLTRAGVQFTDEQKKQIKAMQDAGNMAGAQKVMLAELERQFGGSAAAQATATDRMKIAFGNLQEQVGAKLIPVVERFSAWVVEVGIPAMERFAGWIQENVVPAVQAMAEGIGEAIGFLADWWREHWDQIRTTATQVIENVRTVVEGVLGAIEAFWRTWGGTIVSLVTGVFDGIRQVVEGALRVIQGIINVVMGLIRGDFSRVWEGIQQIFSGAWEIINGVVDAAMAAVRAVIETGMRLVAGAFDAAWEGIKSATSAAIDALVEFVQALPNRILTALAGLATLLVGLGLDLINGLGTGIRNAWEALIAFVESIPGMVLGVFRDAGSWLFQIGKDIIQGLWNGVKEIWDRMTGWIADAADKLPGFLKRALGINSPSRVMREVGQFTMLGLHEGMKDGWSPIPGWLEDIGDSMADRASEMSDAMSWAVEDMGTAMVGSMSSTMDTMVDVVAAGAKRAVDAWYPAIIAIDEQYRNNEPLYDPDPEGVLERANEERRRQMNDSRAAAAAAAPAGDLTLNFNAPVSRSDATYISDTVQRTLMSNQMRVALAGA